ncbi:sulfotransferase [Lignipirellula cremea]|uniref:Sulfotransferase domain protein n=1 Tax=Lignipirellula cremea TaxID=2528010 RepID=A0A518E3Q9_9BACT|nr:sulfotransferase [Lignipirellula cremea]QDU98730.1 hypothetical protein Pla8534_66030 [Lignipirellula cremea]
MNPSSASDAARLFFVSGMPRAGSTLLVNLLAQNPQHHVTPTSGLIHLVLAVMERWTQVAEFQAQGLEQVKPQVEASLQGLLLGFHRQALSQGKCVFDKSRGWLDYVEPLEQVLQRRLKILVPIRDVRSVVASFEKMYRRRGIAWRYPQGQKYALSTSAEQRARTVLDPDQVVGRSIVRLRDALSRVGDRLLLVPYGRFTEFPQAAMQALHQTLELPPYEYDPLHVAQQTHEDDNFVGQDLHRIRERIEPQAAEPWTGLLSPDLAAEIAEEYADINALAAGPVASGG